MKWTDRDKKKVTELAYKLVKDIARKGFKVRRLQRIEFTETVSQHGCCVLWKGRNVWQLRLSWYRLQDGWEAIRNTILHEICHAIAPFKEGHGPVWKKIAKQIGDLYHIKITRTSPHTDKVKAMTSKYLGKCDKCGKSWGYTRKTKLVKAVEKDHAKDWTCKCGSHHFSLVSVKGGK